MLASAAVLAIVCAPVLLLTACSSVLMTSNLESSLTSATPPNASAPANVPQSKLNTVPRRKAAAALQALRQNKLKLASRYFNQALKLDIQNSYLQFFNGLTYHLMAVEGDAKYYPLAAQGYALAAEFDKSNWLAPFYHGLLDMDQKRWADAQEHFARAALIKPQDPAVLYQLAASSYYAGQPGAAYTALRRLRKIDKKAGSSSRTLQGLIVTTSALRRFKEAEKYFAVYREAISDADDVKHLRSRIDSWKNLHATAKSRTRLASLHDSGNPTPRPNKKRLAQFVEPVPPPGAVLRPGVPAQPAAPGQPGTPGAFAETSMVMVDVVLIGTEEDESESRGVNLLSGLRLQFGNPLAPNPAAFSLSWQKTEDRALPPNQGGLSDVRTLIRAIQIPSVNYSLNIMNSDHKRSEIIAKPTLTALVGQPSKFFSGVDVNAAAVSGAAGDSVAIQKSIGVLLQVTPETLPNDMVKLRVKAERTFLTTPSQSVVFQFRLDTTKTSVDANVAMKFGETLILSGLMERASETNRDGTPVAQEIPIVQYFFSHNQKRVFNKSVLILLTPRRPHYVGQSRSERRKAMSKMSKRERAINRLARRYRDWFLPMPNDAVIFQHLQFNQLYLEFRTGDFPLERWDHSEPHERRLDEALRYLYF